jgi:hypothetical protein
LVAPFFFAGGGATFLPWLWFQHTTITTRLSLHPCGIDSLQNATVRWLLRPFDHLIEDAPRIRYYVA